MGTVKGGLGIDLQDAFVHDTPWTGHAFFLPAPNLGRGIPPGPDGVTSNDNCDLDGPNPATADLTADDGDPTNKGSNDLQNWPELQNVVRKGKKTLFQGFLISRPDRWYRIEFFSTPLPDLSSPADREGKVFLGAILVTDTDGDCRAEINSLLSVGFPNDHVVTATATRHVPDDPYTPGNQSDPLWSTSEFSNRGGEAVICEDDDDHDSDLIRDDFDNDDDNDGDKDDYDSDDDSEKDSEPSDTDSDSDSERDSDNDCIEDDFDSESKKERAESVDHELEEGEEKTYDLVADANTLLLTATASALSYVEPNYQPLTVEIYAPNGTLLASSPPIPGRAIVTAVPALAGTFKVKIRNGAQAKVRYQSVRITKEFWLP